MDVPILQDIIIIFALSIAAIFACYRLNFPTIVGFLATGVVCGPHGLGLIQGIPEVNSLASIGIALLLFIVGMEFSIKNLLEYKHFFWLGGTLQIALTAGVGFAVATLLGRPAGESLFLGFLLAMSSTAITIGALDKRSETDTPFGRITMGILIFQDLLAVPIMLSIPLLAGKADAMNSDFLWLLFKGILLLAVVCFGALKVVPKLLYHAAKTRSKELFLLTVLTVCFGVALLSSSVGLTLSIGAFLAGLVISESEYTAEAASTLQPLQMIFTSFFFVSIGMLLDVSFLVQHPILIVSLAAAIMLMKAILATGTIMIMKMPLRASLLAGLALSQIGEFSFVLARAGMESGIGSDFHHQLFFAVSFLTMAITPSLIGWGPQIASFIAKLPISQKWKLGLAYEGHKPKVALEDHLIVIGYGLSGRNTVRSAKAAKIPYTIIDMNPDTVRLERALGEPIHFGDATHEAILRHSNIMGARIVAVVVNDHSAAYRIVEKAKKLNPQVTVIVRTRYLKDTQQMYNLGADIVVPDEFGTSIEIFSRVLQIYKTPAEMIEKLVEEVRTEGYDMLRLLYQGPLFKVTKPHEPT